MTKEDLLRFAREAGFADGVVEIVGLEGFSRFAAFVAAHERAAEREACAKVCDVMSTHPEYASGVTKLAAAAIRSRT